MNAYDFKISFAYQLMDRLLDPRMTSIIIIKNDNPSIVYERNILHYIFFNCIISMIRIDMQNIDSLFPIAIQ